MTVKKLQDVFGEWPLRVGYFEKVSYEQFKKDWLNTYNESGDEELQEENVIKDAYDTLPIPTRNDVLSAGYDFYSPLSFVLDPDEEIVIPTGINVHIIPGFWLMCAPRSGMGFKYYVRFANTIGVIDGSFVYTPGEGNIFIKIRNESNKRMSVNKGDRFCQGIFVIHGITDDDNANGTRTGGLGSSGK